MSPDVRQELQRLLSALCDSQLTDVQHARLEKLLDADAECRRLYLEYLDMHARLLGHPHLQGSRSDTTTQPEELSPHASSRRRRIPYLLRYLAVAGATLAASLLFQVYWRPQTHTDNGDDKTRHEAVRPAASEYVATLTQTASCEWGDSKEPRRAGSRLVPGDLRLSKGVARIRFDSGADLIVEGPADIRLDSGTSATVLRGKVVFRADEMAAPFDLHTPAATLADLGTEYAVAVGAEGEEVHVFDGEVVRTRRNAPDKAGPEHLKAGEARRYGPAPDSASQPPALDPASFVRQVVDSRDPLADAKAELIAYEGFDYKDPHQFHAGKANGGYGWTSSWQRGLARPLNEGDRNLFVLKPNDSLTRHGAAVPSAGGCFEYAGFAKFHRRLAKPIRLDADGVYYLSFLFRRDGLSDDPVNAVAVLLRTSDELKKENDDPRKRLNIGVGGPNQNQLFTHLGGVGSRTPLPLSYGQTYLLVAKIAAAGGSNPDQVFIRIYGPQEAVETEEPSSWTVVGPPFQSDLVFDWLEVHINSKARQTIDEIRVGTTWPSVTAPWIGPPGQK
jgi:ferric-dicitrate binding protein FerR (iron transport regulator)